MGKLKCRFIRYSEKYKVFYEVFQNGIYQKIDEKQNKDQQMIEKNYDKLQVIKDHEERRNKKKQLEWLLCCSLCLSLFPAVSKNYWQSIRSRESKKGCIACAEE